MGRHVGDDPLEKLLEYRPPLQNRPADFDQFWETQKNEMRSRKPVVSIKWRDYPVPGAEVADILFKSWDGTPLKGLIVKPASMEECPLILSFHGYTGDCGLAVDYLPWVAAGAAVLSFDVRGQGNSPDYGRYPNGSRIPGWMLHGITDHTHYYYTNVYRDILLQLQWIRSQEFPFRATITGAMGGSQGGGLALAAAGLDGSLDFVAADWPFIAHFERALEVSLSGPYMEIVNYFKWNDPQYQTRDQVLKTLGYIDCVHFCQMIKCPVLMAAGLEDPVTPPSTVFAAFNHLGTKEKKIETYPQFTHEQNRFHEEKKVEFIMKQLMKKGESGQ